MALTLTATIGGEDSNSYVTVEEADAELAYRFDSKAWFDVNTTDDDKIIALFMACRKIDSKQFIGVRYDEAQALQFPRYMADTVRLITDSIFMRDSNIPVMPRDVKLAQILEANEILSRKDSIVYNRTTREQLIREGVKSIRSGNTAETYDKSMIGEFYSAEAENLLSGLIRKGY